MNAAARELALIGHAKAREPVHATARAMRAAFGLAPAPILSPTLILTAGDRVR